MSGSKIDSISIPGKLVGKFKNLPSTEHGSAWSELWDEGASDLWDRACPSPSLVDLLEKQFGSVIPASTRVTRRTALVPGCGRGYDVILLALHGYDAYGLEISPGAVSAGESYIISELPNPSPMYFFNSSESERGAYIAGRGAAHMLAGDFFAYDWAREDVPTKFDLIYDYTFFCALPPDVRQQWGMRMSELLNPGGHLISVEFPLYKDPSAPGPPWGVSGAVYWDVLVRGGSGILTEPVSQDVQDSHSEGEHGKFVKLVRIKPQRSHIAGKGTDMISVWSRKSG